MIQRRQERQRRVRIRAAWTKTPPTSSNTCLFPSLGPGPSTYADGGALRPPGPRRVWSPLTPATLSPPPSESPPFSRQALPHRPLPQGPGRSGPAVPWTRLPPATSLAPHPGPLPTPSPIWTSPGGWFRGGLSSRCPAVTCRAADRRRDRVGGGEEGKTDTRPLSGQRSPPPHPVSPCPHPAPSESVVRPPPHPAPTQ